MVNGQFDCFGNIQNIKSVYGKGYTLILKCKLQGNSEDEIRQRCAVDVVSLQHFINANIPNAIIKGELL